MRFADRERLRQEVHGSLTLSALRRPDAEEHIYRAEHADSGARAVIPVNANTIMMRQVRDVAADVITDMLIKTPPPNGWWLEGVPRPDKAAA